MATKCHRGDRRSPGRLRRRPGGGSPPRQETRTQFASWARGPGSRPGASFAQRLAAFAGALGGLGRPGGHSEGQNTRSHPELGRENPQRRWYCALRRGRVGRRQARQTAEPCPIRAIGGAIVDPRTLIAGWSSPVARQAHNLKVIGSNPIPATSVTCSPSRPSVTGRLLSALSARMAARADSGQFAA